VNMASRRHVTENDKFVFLLPREQRTWTEMQAIYEFLETKSPFTPVFILANGLMHQKNSVCEAQNQRHEVIELDPQSPLPGIGPDDFFRKLGIYANQYIAHSCLVGAIRFLRTRAALKRVNLRLAAVLKKYRPVAALLPGDRELSPVPEFLRAASQNNVPTIIWSASLSATPEACLQVRKGHRRHFAHISNFPPLLNLLASWFWPKQIMRMANKGLIFSPGWLTFALSSQGMLPNNPWCIGGGQLDLVCLLDHRSHREFTSMGVSQEKLRLIGDLSRDALFETYSNRADVRRQYSAEYDFTPDQPVAIYSIPSLWEQNLLEWSEHEFYIRQIVASLQRQFGDGLLLNLHPRCDKPRYQFLSEELQARVVDAPLSRFLPISDLYVTLHSSTIEWSSLCQIPTIDFDYIGFDQQPMEYSHTTIVQDIDAFECILTENTCAIFDKYRDGTKQDDAVDQSGTFDGMSAARFLDLLQELERDSDAFKTDNLIDNRNAS